MELCTLPIWLLPASQPLWILAPARPLSVSPSPHSPFLAYGDPHGSRLSPFSFFHFHFLTCHYIFGILFLFCSGSATWTQGVSCHFVTFCSLWKKLLQPLFHPHPQAAVGPLWTRDPLPDSSMEPHPNAVLESSVLTFPQPSAETWVRQPPI